MEPNEIARRIEESAVLPAGDAERFAGYAVIGLPFRSGHVLALRRFPASSVGPGYTSVWHRSPRGSWTFYSTVQPDLACSRYFGGEVTRNVVATIEIDWTRNSEFTVKIDNWLRWELRLAESWSTRLINLAASLCPDRWWRKKRALRVMGAASRLLLRAGKMNLTGETPNGQEFLTNPLRVWMISSSRAILAGEDLGPVGALARQARLNDFFIPQRGMFAVARALMQSRTRGYTAR